MLDFSPKRKALSTFSLASLTDIVLLLLVFFLLTSNFIPQFGIQVNLPRVSTSASVEPESITVVITKEQQFYVDGQAVPREQLRAAVQEAAAGKRSLILRADQEATVGNLAEVASIAKALDLGILIATERGDLRPR